MSHTRVIPSQLILTFFSFGAIKTNTAYGGCVCRIKDSDIAEEMNEIQNSYKSQSKGVYLKKIVSTFGAALLLNSGLNQRITMEILKSNRGVAKTTITDIKL